MKPNLFNIATRELSQDAFITWLLQWASPECAAFDAPLHNCAIAFTKKLLSLQTEAPATIDSIKAGRQWDHIDVWAEVNNDLLLIIEDKTFTGQHSGQLKRYRESASTWCNKNARRLVSVYLKTGSESSSSLNKVRNDGYAVFSRKDFISCLDAHAISNAIFVDFRDRIIALEQEENQYCDKAIVDWKAPDWKGFYQGLEQLRPVIDWNLVNPPSGASFWNAVLNWYNYGASNAYMQIEQGALCFKLGEVYENHAEVRDRFHRILMEGCKNRPEIKRPRKFGSGTYMTVAVVGRTDWLGPDDGKVNMMTVASRLNEYETLLIQILENAQQGVAPYVAQSAPSGER